MASIQLPKYYDKFKVAREQINIDALAKASCLYFAINAVDTTLLARDPMKRDQLYESMSNDPQVSKDWIPEAVVPPETGPEGVDRYLALVDVEIAARTPPKTFEECVLCSSSSSEISLGSRLQLESFPTCMPYIFRRARV